MAISSKLLEILCCPVSHKPLSVLGQSALTRLNDDIERGDILYVDGSIASEEFDSALVTDDGQVIYGVIDQLPDLLPDHGIGTAQFKDR